MVHYRLVSVSNYPNDRKFYKRLQYSLKKLRKLFPQVNQKFEDPTRPVRVLRMPNPKIELWVEKSSLEFFLRNLAEKYHVPTLAERGFGSLSMFRKAVVRAKRRGVKRILFVSDHDPSGLEINKVTVREMPVEVKRIALTLDQVKKYRLLPIKVKRKDSRAKKYIEKYGDKAWEVEAIPPRSLLYIVEKKLIENIPQKFLEQLRVEKEAAKIIRPLEKQILGRLRSEAITLKQKGMSKGEIFRRLTKKFRFGA